MDTSISAAELGRKAIHLTALVIPLGGYFSPLELTRWILFSVTVVALMAEYLRLSHQGVASVFERIFGSMLKHRERRFLTGSSYLLVSATACFFLFPRIIAVAALSFLILGDTAAALVGRRWGRKNLFGKSLAGSLACLLACLLVGLLLPGLPRQTGVIGALGATLFELLPLRLDDNLIVPLASGLLMVVF